jgi:2-keto-4-pentenoate hydratase/2-oxohepta-3-ene-1,7-dioic acid hydratase in catechol pathway
MRFVRYLLGQRLHHGLLHLEDGIIERLEGSLFDAASFSGERDPIGSVKLVAPIDPPRIFGVGLNYAAHAKEAGQPNPSFPMLFMKPPTAVIGPDEAIVYPRQGKRVDFECELAVVIGRQARRIPQAQALEAVFGYTCANDVSERSIQFAEMKTGTMVIGKAFDTFCPLGPAIVTDIDPGNLAITTRLNGETRQKSHTSDLIFSVAEIVAYLSDAITLLPGDVILTGTPAGIGPMQPGDVVEIEIEKIGVLRNTVVADR